MKTAYIIGAGQLGSRHLQALKAVQEPLRIVVVDPSEESLATARERFAAAPGTQAEPAFLQQLPDAEKVDIAIIATTAKHRRAALESLLKEHRVRYLVLEKVLFTKREDYGVVEKLLEQKATAAWVNCARRIMPCYEYLKERLAHKPITYVVSGSQIGMGTSGIHFLDHFAQLTGAQSFHIDTAGIDPRPTQSKREGYLELTGRLHIKTPEGSSCTIVSYPRGTLPLMLRAENDSFRYVGRETEGKAWTCTAPDWIWIEEEATIPYVSTLTTELVETLFRTGDCALPTYTESAALHLAILDAYKGAIKTGGTDDYPFT